MSDRLLGAAPSAEQQRTVGYGSLEAVLDTLEQAVTGDRYIAGERFSAADVYVGSHIAWGMQFGSIDRRPGFTEYWQRIGDRPARIRTTELDDAALREKQGQLQQDES